MFAIGYLEIGELQQARPQQKQTKLLGSCNNTQDPRTAADTVRLILCPTRVLHGVLG